MRPARREDRAVAVALLYESAAPYYDAYAGSPEAARRVLTAVFEKPGHTASLEHCWVAERDGEVVGVLACFAAARADGLARRFLALTLVRLPAQRWPTILRHLRSASVMTPVPPRNALYVDALAVAEGARRQGVARFLLGEAQRLADERGLDGVALDTGLHNTAAQQLYETAGFVRRDVRHAPNERVARAVGGPGFIAYYKPSSQ